MAQGCPVSVFYVLAGRVPVPEPDLMTWARWMSDDDHIRVGRDRVGPVRISTIFLGTAAGPRLFETAVFAEDVPRLHGCLRRYRTWQEAQAGHARIVGTVRRYLGRLGESA